MTERPPVDVRSLAALITEWLVIASAMYVAVSLSSAWVYAAVFVIVATRQHGLLMLYHDAVHGLLARNLRVNDFLINLFVGVPHMVPVEVYRPLHLAHHRKLGTDEDPERLLLYANQRWRYRPLPTKALLRQLLGDLFVVNGIRTLTAWRRSGAGIPLTPMVILSFVTWLAAVVSCMLIAPLTVLTVLLLWFVPLLTLTNLLQKLRSFAEHSGGPGVTPGWNDWTYSWRVGLPGRLTIWPYNINHHLEHHTHPNVPWHQLQALSATIAAASDSHTLWSLLHRGDAHE